MLPSPVASITRPLVAIPPLTVSAAKQKYCGLVLLDELMTNCPRLSVLPMEYVPVNVKLCSPAVALPLLLESPSPFVMVPVPLAWNDPIWSSTFPLESNPVSRKA